MSIEKKIAMKRYFMIKFHNIMKRKNKKVSHPNSTLYKIKTKENDKSVNCCNAKINTNTEKSTSQISHFSNLNNFCNGFG